MENQPEGLVILTKIPNYALLVDAQYIQIEGPDGILTGYKYDQQTRSVYFKESQVVFSSRHGQSHISEDPIPDATCDLHGLMSADDKCKLEALAQTRIGVVGYQGGGFPDDGGWLSGDIIFAAGTDFISLERIGNVIRITADSFTPLNCECFLPGARVLMGDGTTKAIETIEIGDKVVTHTGSIKRVVRLFKNHHDGLVYNWKADKHSGEAFSITGNHPVLAMERSAAYQPAGRARKKIKDKPRWIEASAINPGDLIVRRRSHDQVEDVVSIDVLHILGDGFVERDGLVYSVRPDGHIDGMANGIPRHLPVDNDLLDLLGYYAAEGCADRKNGVRFSVHTEEMVFGDIGAEISRILATMFGFEPSINGRATPNGRDIQVFCVPLVELFSRWFGKKRNKKFPEWVMLLPPSKQARIIAALMRGDGYIASHPAGAVYFRLGMGSRSIIDQALFMAERCGWEPAHQEPKLDRGYIKYRMSITDSNAPHLCALLGVEPKTKMLSREKYAGNHVMHRLVEKSSTHYVGFVHNFEVEDDNSYIVDGLVVHNCEECNQLFWLQDETEAAAIRPPTCSGKLPNVSSYGEMKVYLMPESTIVDTSNPAATLRNKGNYPSLAFRRYGNSLTPGLGMFEVVLKRNAVNKTQTEIGHVFTPNSDRVECIWYVGLDDSGNQMYFEFVGNAESGLLGSLMYKGHLITKQMAVIVDYTSTVLTNNQYKLRFWDVLTGKAVGDTITATNLWRFATPEEPGRANLLDVTVDVLPIGTLVDIWQYQVGEVSNAPIYRYFFNKQPPLNQGNLWTMVGGVEFGDLIQVRSETEVGGTDAAVEENDIDDFENTVWGLTGRDVPMMLFSDVDAAGTEDSVLNLQHRAIIDTSLPGLRVQSDEGTEPFSQRPVMLWHRTALSNSALVRAEVGSTTINGFTPYDLLLNAAIDNHDGNVYMKVVGTGTVSGLPYVRVKGASFHDLPKIGTVRIINTNSGHRNRIFNYYNKLMFPAADDDSIALMASAEDHAAFPGSIGDVVELLPKEYSAPCVRLEFSIANDGTVSLQFKVGILGMDTPYENAQNVNDSDDFVRGLRAGYAVSAVYTQAGAWSGMGTHPASNVDGFHIYDGGEAADGNEYWNVLEVMLRQGQVWIWWNGLLIPPSTALSAALPTPVAITTPYFPVTPLRIYGKTGLRMWPTAKLRRMEVRSQPRLFSEFTYGQLSLQ